MGDNASYIGTEYGDENGIYMEQYRVQYRALVFVVLNLRFSLPHVYVVFLIMKSNASSLSPQNPTLALVTETVEESKI
jgi:hypothetical protein